MKLEEIQSSSNLTSMLEKEQLLKICSRVIRGYELDETSREEWKEVIDKAMEIAKQSLGTPKTYPWPNASNIKYPLITEAAINYAARTLPEIIQNEKVVKASTTGKDPDGIKFRRADRVSRYMSYQLTCESSEWEKGTDKLLQILPILGTVFKKTYFSVIKGRIISELCVPDKVVVNYDAPSLEEARRVTHIITLYSNDIIERQRKNIFNDEVDIESMRPDDFSSDDDDFPIELLEQHCWIDLDDDGYKEPYVVTIHKKSEQVLRIVPRIKKIEFVNKKEVSNIEAFNYFTDFHFIPSPDGGFYSMGFGSLLLPINKAVNTLFNLLIDSGVLSNTQGGFLGRGLRIKNGEFEFKMGKWHVLDAASGTNISQNVVPLPVREPSQVLLSLLSLLIQMGKDLSSTTDVMQGRQPAQNVANGTINQLIEQGTKVFNAINKRVYRSLKDEYSKIYQLNYLYLDNNKYTEMLDDPEADVKQDFELESMSIHPVADPLISSDVQRLNKASVLQTMRTVDPRAADLYMADAMQLDSSQITQLFPPPDPNAEPPPEQLLTMSEVRFNDAKVAEIAAKTHVDVTSLDQEVEKLRQYIRESNSRISEGQGRVWKMTEDVVSKRKQLAIAEGKMQAQAQQKFTDSVQKQQRDKVEQYVKLQSENTKSDKVLLDAHIGAAKLSLKEKELNNDEKNGD